MIKLEQALLVEGKYDAARLANIVDGTILTTDGFRVFRDAALQKLLKRILFCACAVAVICGLVAAGGAISNAIQEQNEREALVASVTAYDDKYVPNVYVDGIHLGGMTRAEAEEAVTAHANQQRDAWKVRLMYAGQLVREITSADLNMTVDVQEARRGVAAGAHRRRY